MSAGPIRETEVLVCLACFRYLNSTQVAGFVFEGSRLTPQSQRVTTQQILERLRKQGLISSTSALVGGPGGGSARPAYFLTAAGQRLVDALEGRPRARRSNSGGTLFVSHALVAADVALAFRHAARSHPGHEVREWESDRDAAERLRPSRVIPDARLVYRTPSWEIDAFVEIDLGSERVSRFAQKVSEYLAAWRSGTWRAHLRSWPLVLTVTTSAERAIELRRATDELLRLQRDAERVAKATEFDFASLTEVRDTSGPLSSIWQVAGHSGLRPLIPDDGDRSAT